MDGMNNKEEDFLLLMGEDSHKAGVRGAPQGKQWRARGTYEDNKEYGENTTNIFEGCGNNEAEFDWTKNNPAGRGQTRRSKHQNNSAFVDEVLGNPNYVAKVVKGGIVH